MYPRSTIITAAILSAFSGYGRAQTNEPALASEITPILITATRFPSRLENTSGQVEVVTADDLAIRKIDKLSDAIKFIPGLSVQPGRGPLQGSQTMSLRGIPDERRMSILLDGIPLNDGYAGSVNLAGLPVESLNQVEVLFGPMSALYGGTAMSGVVSYTTRMPTRTQFNASIGYGAPFEQGKGADNLRKLSFSAGTKFDNELSVLIGGSWMATDGYRTEEVTTGTMPASTLRGWSNTSLKTGAAGYLVGNKGVTDWDENGQYLKLEQRVSGLNRWRFSWQRQAYEYGSSDPQTYLRNSAGTPIWSCCSSSVLDSSFLNGQGGYERNIFSLGGDIEFFDGVLKLTASYIDVDTNYYVTPLGTINGGSGRISDSPTQSKVLDAYWNRQLDAHGVTLGTSWRHDKAHNTDYTLNDWRDITSTTSLYATASGATDSVGIYAQDEWQLTGNLLAHLGLRYDYWKNSNGNLETPGWTPASSRIFKDYDTRSADSWNPKVALRYQLTPGFALRGSYGSAFRAPSVYELYRSGKIGSTLYSANPELKPETVKTIDLGSDFSLWQGGEFKLTAFSNRMENLIYTQGGSSKVKERINAEEARSSGFTLAFAQRLGTDTRLSASYTLTDSEVIKNGRSTASEGKLLTFLPKHQATLGADTRQGAWSLAANMRYASKQYASDDNSDIADGVYGVYDAYVVADARFNYRFDKHFSASLAIDNLFDKSYYSYYPAPGRTWFASLAYRY